MLKGIRGFDPTALRGAMKNEFGGQNRPQGIDSFVRPGRTLTNLIECRYPGETGIGTYQWYVERFQTIARYEKAGPDQLPPEREIGEEDLASMTLDGEMERIMRDIEDRLLHAYEDASEYLGDVMVSGKYYSKDFWLAVAQAVDKEAGTETSTSVSFDDFSDEIMALVFVGKQVGEPGFRKFESRAQLDVLADRITTTIADDL